MDEIVVQFDHTNQTIIKWRYGDVLRAMEDAKDDLPTNLWLGVTVENQQAADERIPHLLQTPAAVRFVSVEPMLSRVVLGKRCRICGGYWEASELFYSEGDCPSEDCGIDEDLLGVDWVIIGCESGPERRPCNLEWVRDLVRQCQAAGVAVFVKQLDINGKVSHNPADWPEDLRVQEFPLC